MSNCYHDGLVVKAFRLKREEPEEIERFRRFLQALVRFREEKGRAATVTEAPALIRWARGEHTELDAAGERTIR
jgi:hypothetical protein